MLHIPFTLYPPPFFRPLVHGPKITLFIRFVSDQNRQNPLNYQIFSIILGTPYRKGYAGNAPVEKCLLRVVSVKKQMQEERNNDFMDNFYFKSKNSIIHPFAYQKKKIYDSEYKNLTVYNK